MDHNKALVYQWFEVWNQHALDRLATFVAPTYCHHSSSGAPLDFTGFRQGFEAVLRAYPDMQYSIVHLIAEADLVAVYLIATGTQHGAFFGIAPSHKRSSFAGVYHCRIQNGQIVEDWDIFDMLTALFRLGATLQSGEPT